MHVGSKDLIQRISAFKQWWRSTTEAECRVYRSATENKKETTAFLHTNTRNNNGFCRSCASKIQWWLCVHFIGWLNGW